MLSEPMPPYNPVFGHLLFCGNVLSTLPKDAHPQYLVDQIRRTLPELGPNYYIDTWPFGEIMLVLSTPKTLYQMAQDRSLPKHHNLRTFLYPLTGGLDIVTMEGQIWKTWRSNFNPGFSNHHLMALVPDIVRETDVFSEVLARYATSGESFAMKRHTDDLTMDVIGKVVLDMHFHSQRSHSVMIEALRGQVRSLTFGNTNPLKAFDPFRPIMQWYRTMQMDRALSPELDRRFRLYQNIGNRPSKSVIDLALQTYVANTPDIKGQQTLDPTFKKFALSQTKLFLFSGHDTTSSSICYVLYLLSVHQGALDRVRKEHNDVLGVDRRSSLETDPFLINKLPFTLAVIKESLRLFPVVSGTREGEIGYFIQDDRGVRFPTENFLVWSVPQAQHRDPAFWPQPDDFLPERWLVGPNDALHPVAGMYRPFEHGPRNCIGQELAIIEMKIVLVMELQLFDIEPVYSEIDKKRPRKGPTTVNGERAYQIQLAQPSGDFPCRVKIRDKG